MTMEFLGFVLLVALLAAFVVLVAYKQGLIERVQVHGNDFFYKMVSCQLCLSFWVCVIICIVVFLFTWNLYWLVVPAFSSPITRKLL